MPICNTCFSDYVTRCESAIHMRALLLPDTNYTWFITDKFENEYQGEFTTDNDGNWQIDVDTLPPGLLTEFGGMFTLRVQSENCKPANMLIAQEYDCIQFEVRGGTSTKDQIGCTVECNSNSIGAASELIPFINASSVTIPWTVDRAAAFGNNPRVFVHHKVSGTTYQLVGVPIERVTVDGTLTQLVINNGVAIDGYILLAA